jgi:flagellar operon protein
VSVGLNPALLPPGAAERPRPAGGQGPTRTPSPEAPSFADVLKDATGAQGAIAAPTGATGSTSAAHTSGAEPLRFSKHAMERVQRRGIQLDSSTLGRLQEGVGRAAGKGSRDSVVLVDGTAFVVSVNNRTVLTAVGSEHMHEQVFTNIDSAVIA